MPQPAGQGVLPLATVESPAIQTVVGPDAPPVVVLTLESSPVPPPAPVAAVALEIVELVLLAAVPETPPTLAALTPIVALPVVATSAPVVTVPVPPDVTAEAVVEPSPTLVETIALPLLDNGAPPVTTEELDAELEASAPVLVTDAF